MAARDGMHPVSCVHYAQALMAEGRYLDGLRWAEVAWKQTPVEDPLVRIAAGSPMRWHWRGAGSMTRPSGC